MAAASAKSAKQEKTSDRGRVDLIPVVINGVEVQVPRNHPDPVSGKPVPTTMIQACELAGVPVPHYCYHPKLPVSGNCRMCLVEFAMPALGPDRKPLLNEDGTPKRVHQMVPYDPSTPRVTIACATPVSPGIEILTETPYLKQVRAGVMESLLVNHPLDCPICDQAGECKLQEYSLEHGQSQSQFVEEKVHKPKQVDLGPRIMLDDERCILCSRCIRFTRDLVGDDALGIINRGSYSTLTTFPGETFDNNYTLNTVDICPVGALTSKDFRFQMRVWFLKETKGICTTCGTGCNVLFGSRENRVYRLTPRENEAVNACWMCDEGRLNYRWVGSEERLSQPMQRSDQGGVQPVSWEVLLDDLAKELSGAESGSLALVASARQTTEELYLLSRLAQRWKAMTDSVPRRGAADDFLVNADRNPNTQGARLMGLCSARPGTRLTKIEQGIREGKIRSLIVWGEDVTQHGIEESLLEKLDLLVVSDVLPSATTRWAHFLLPGCAPMEKRGTLINAKGRLQKLAQAVLPPGQARADWQILLALDARLGGGLSPEPKTIEGLFDAMAREIEALKECRWGQLTDAGVDLVL